MRCALFSPASHAYLCIEPVVSCSRATDFSFASSECSANHISLLNHIAYSVVASVSRCRSCVTCVSSCSWYLGGENYSRNSFFNSSQVFIWLGVVFHQSNTTPSRMDGIVCTSGPFLHFTQEFQRVLMYPGTESPSCVPGPAFYPFFLDQRFYFHLFIHFLLFPLTPKVSL